MSHPRSMHGVRDSDRRRVYAWEHPALVCIAFAAAFSGTLFTLFPGIVAKSSLGMALSGVVLERAWTVLYAVAGATVLGGFYRLNAKYEVAGLLLLAGCYLAYGYAVFATRGWEDGAMAASIFIGLACGVMARAAVLRFEPERMPWTRRS